MRGGSSPQTVEIIKTFGQRCPEVVVSNDRDKASYVVLFDRESFKGLLRKRDKIALFRRNGDGMVCKGRVQIGHKTQTIASPWYADGRSTMTPPQSWMRKPKS
jgi:hypothetical protein